MSVGVGYAHGGTVHEPFLRSMLSAAVFDFHRLQLVQGYFSSGGLYIAINRNKIIEEFLKKDDEWLWFLDTDIVFAQDTLYKLLKLATEHDCKVLSALYFSRMRADIQSTQPVWLMECDTGVYETLSEFASGGLYEVDCVGMGCCLIHRSVLERMKEVYDKDEWIWFGHDLVTKSDGSVTHLGEDVTFCRRVRAMDIKIYGTSDVIVGHVKSRVENLETFAEMTGQLSAITSSAA